MVPLGISNQNIASGLGICFTGFQKYRNKKSTSEQYKSVRNNNTQRNVGDWCVRIS